MKIQTQGNSQKEDQNHAENDFIDTTDQKKVGQMTDLDRKERFNIQRVVNRNEIEASQGNNWYDSSDLYKIKKQGETNIFEGVIQSNLYEVFTVYHKDRDIVYEVWKTIKGDPHNWIMGKMNAKEIGDDYVR